MLRIHFFAILIVPVVFFACPLSGFSQRGSTPAFTDTSHFSEVFGHPKHYRLYLPGGYASTSKRYPVIYFFHGWGGRHFKDDNALLNYAGIKTLVDKYQTILVMWDGNIDTAEPRPYNTGDHEDMRYQVQMKDYFPELVKHVDASYRTLTDRYNRGIIGFSMGGFMSFLIAGKYPDKVSAAVSFAGSPEFYVGYPDNHTLYPVRYMFANLRDVQIQLHNGDSDVLYYLNHEVYRGAKWEGAPLNYRKFHGGHMIDKTGETKVFEIAMKFVTASFAKKIPFRPRWSHTDVYPDFTIRDYDVHTNRNIPGYTSLTNVDRSGFGIYARRWFPDGPPLTGADSFSITTAPLYTAGKDYHIVLYHPLTGEITETTNKPGKDGRFTFTYAQKPVETGIFSDGDSASLLIAQFHLADSARHIRSNHAEKLSLTLFNRSDVRLPLGAVEVTVAATDSGVRFQNNKVRVNVGSGQRLIPLPPITVTSNKQPPRHADPPQLNIQVTIRAGKRIFHDHVIVPVLYDARVADSLQVDDHRVIRDTSFGTGNGDGVADAGEQVMLYSGSNRLRLYTNDKWIIQQEEKLVDEMVPAVWPDGFTLNSVISISPECPDGHVIEFTGSYETKAYNPIERKTNWVKIKLPVRNSRAKQ